MSVGGSGASYVAPTALEAPVAVVSAVRFPLASATRFGCSHCKYVPERLVGSIMKATKFIFVEFAKAREGESWTSAILSEMYENF